MTLSKVDGDVLKVKVPYEQLKPHMSSVIHENVPQGVKAEVAEEAGVGKEAEIAVGVKAEAGVSEVDVKAEVDVKGEVDVNGEVGVKAEDNGRAEIVFVSEHKKRAKKRPIGPLPVEPAVLANNTSELLPLIKSGEWLTDEHIDHAQAILAKHFPYIGGLQAVWVFISEGCQSLGTPKEEFIQIINVTGNHWITVSNIGNPKDTITIYDSLYGDISPSYKAKFLRQVAYMVMATSSQITLQWADTQKQKGTSDCGLFAIAAATSLCYGISPQYCTWEQEKMREHLSECFERGDLVLFPQLPAARGHKWYTLPLQTTLC